MDKRPLIVVSLCAVVLLVLGSLSNVVGYQSIKSTVNDSPLFQTRTQRATNQQQNSITSQYLGKDSRNIISIPLRNYQTYLIQEIIAKIKEMNDREFNAFKQKIISYLLKEKLIQNKDDIRVLNFFKQIKYNSNEINENISQGTNPPTSMEYCFTVEGEWNTCQSSNECKFYELTFILGLVFIFSTMFILGIIESLLGLFTIKVCYR